MKRLLSAMVLATVAVCAGCGGNSGGGGAKDTSASLPATTATATRTTGKSSGETACTSLITDPHKSGICHLGQGQAVIAGRGKSVVIGDVGARVLSMRTAKVIPGGSGLPTRTASGTFVILNLEITNHGNSPLNWDNEIDGRTQLIVGAKTFDHDGDAESNLPGTLDQVGQSIPPDGSDQRAMVYDVTSPSLGKLHSTEAFLAVISTKQLEQGDDITTASKVGLVRLPR